MRNGSKLDCNARRIHCQVGLLRQRQRTIDFSEKSNSCQQLKMQPTCQTCPPCAQNVSIHLLTQSACLSVCLLSSLHIFPFDHQPPLASHTTFPWAQQHLCLSCIAQCMLQHVHFNSIYVLRPRSRVIVIGNLFSQQWRPQK